MLIVTNVVYAISLFNILNGNQFFDRNNLSQKIISNIIFGGHITKSNAYNKLIM